MRELAFVVSDWLRRKVLGLRWAILRLVAGRMVVAINLELVNGTITWGGDKCGFLLNVRTTWTEDGPDRTGLAAHAGERKEPAA